MKKLKQSDNSGFLLTLELVYEKLQERGVEAEITMEDLKCCLSGMQVYNGQTQIFSEFLYLTDLEHLREQSSLQYDTRLVVCGMPKKGENLPFSYCIFVPESYGMVEILNELQQIFYEYACLERKLNHILTEEGTIYEICEAAVEHFRATVFVHDEFYHIIACPKIEDDRVNFTYNEKTDQYTQDADTINHFRTSPSYKKTLTTKGGCVWESDFDDESCLYANIWLEDKYRGRLIVGKQKSEIRPGQLAEVSYFAFIIERALLQRGFRHEKKRYPVEKMIVDALDGMDMNRKEVREELADLGWAPEDQYVCGYLAFEEGDFTRMSVYGICNSIEERIRGSCTCYHGDQLYVLFNLTRGEMNTQMIRMKMSYIVRESLCFMGVSLPFSDFFDMGIYFRQAQISVKYSKQEQAPRWYTEFGEHVLKYWIMEGMGEFSPRTMMPEVLKKLARYDEAHGTELMRTLKVYLMNERNGTLTAQILKINRSTLPYRLERIHKVAGGIDLEDEKCRMYLMMGLLLMEYL
ncbi:MAG: helix-turn-helix domain-containing protein [Lachnospiraceae bacterium]|nr:helix-turn-helix domain-containing protein [Lachnospiraceae bacterium]